MKKLLLLLALISAHLCLSAQDTGQSPAGKKNKIFVGASYSYMSMDMKLTSLSLQSVWYGEDIGTTELNDDEIDEINDFVDRQNDVNVLCLEAGMVLLDKAESKWKLRGQLMLGIAQNMTTVYNKATDVQEYSFNSGFSKPCLGLGFDLGYELNAQWGLVFRPFVVGTMGTTEVVDDMINPIPLNFTASREDKYNTIYLRGSLMASYTTGPVTLLLGPGIYNAWSHHEYTREYTNTLTGDVLKDITISNSIPKSFFDGSFAMIYRVAKPFSVHAHVGFGGDIQIDAGVHYSF